MLVLAFKKIKIINFKMRIKNDLFLQTPLLIKQVI